MVFCSSIYAVYILKARRSKYVNISKQENLVVREKILKLTPLPKTSFQLRIL